MSVNPLLTNQNANTAIFAPLVGTGQLNASSINTSTIIAYEGIITNLSTVSLAASTINAHTANFYDMNSENISTNLLLANSTLSDFMSTQFLDATTIYTSTIFSYEVFIDNQGLTATPTSLLLNGIPLATLSSIQALSSISYWSYYPALSTIFMDNNSIVDGNNIQAFSGNFQSLTTTVLTVNTVVARSTINVYSTTITKNLDADYISSSVIETSSIAATVADLTLIRAGDITFSTLNGLSSFIDTMTTSTVTFNSAVPGSLTVNPTGSLLYNGQVITTGGGGSSSNWSQYPATQAVNMNGQALNSAGAVSVASLGSSGDINSSGTIGAPRISATTSLNGPALNVLNNAGIGGDLSADKITSRNLLNAQNGVNGVGSISLIGGLGDSVILSTDNNATGIRLQFGAMLVTTAAAFSLNAGGAGNLAAGGALNLAAGDYIELNAGRVQCIGGSSLEVNQIKSYNSGSIAVQSPVYANSNLVTPTLVVNTITTPTAGVAVSIPAGIKTVSTIVDVSSINGIAVSNFVNQQVVSSFNTASISSLNASSIISYYLGVSALETASIDRVSTLNASSITTNFIAVGAIETASIDRVSTLNASSITTNFISVGAIENVSSITVSTINGLPTVPFVAQYYKTATQNFPTGLTDVTWQSAQPWTNTGGYITQTNTSTFTVQRPGVYQFEFAVAISANAQTWTTTPSKDIRINVIRPPGAAQAFFFNRITPQNPLDWANSVIGTGALTTGDQIVCNLGQTLTTAGSCLIQSLSNVFDTNTAFTWTLIKPL